MEVRKYDSSRDKQFVTSYWLNYYRKNSNMGRSIPASVYFEHHRRLVDKALNRCLTYMMVDPHDKDHLIGFINFYRASDYNVLNFIFIKKNFRQHGLGKQFFEIMEGMRGEKESLVITHEGNLKRLPEKYEKITYNPYLFFME